MVPQCYPSILTAVGTTVFQAKFITDTTGLVRWTDYIPVKLAQGGVQNRTDTTGFISLAPAANLSSTAVNMIDYIKVYVDNAATDAWQVSATGYIPYGIADVSAGASMVLDFQNNTLDPRITFSRASNATLTNSSGEIAYAPHNLLTHSEAFENAAWSKSNSTITANAVVAPDGTITADKLVPTLSGGYINGNLVSYSPTQYVLSVYAKKGEFDFIVLSQSSTVTGTTKRAWFNLATGTVGTVTSDAATITAVGNGWFRVTSTFTSTLSGSSGVGSIISPADADNSTNSTPSGSNGLYIWGAQLNVGALQPYYTTAVKNMLGFTQEFDNAAWSKNGGTSIVSNTATAPDGTITADTLVGATNVTWDTTFRSLAIAVSINTTYTASIWVKSAGATTVTLRLRDNNGSGVVGNATPITSVWQRVVLTVTTSGTAASLNFMIGAGGGDIYIWGAQLSNSASLDPYVYNPAAAFTSSAYYGPRFDYDPVTLQPKGLLIEEQRTNSIRNNTMVGASAPSTLPTNWTTVGPGLGTLTQTYSLTTVNGISCIDIRLSGTTSTTGHGYQFDGFTAIAASVSQVWTGTAYVAIVGGSTTNVTSLSLRTHSRDSGSVSLSSNSTNILAIGSTLSRQTSIHTMPASTAYTSLDVLFVFSSGVAIDITLRIGLPQLELGAFATSVIPTTTASVTRAADVATMVGDNFYSWYNQSEGTLFVDGSTMYVPPATAQYLLSAGTTGSNENRIRFVNGNVAAQIHSAAGETYASVISATANTRYAVSLAYKTNDAASSFNGSSPSTDTTVTIPSAVTTFRIGSNQTPSQYLNGHISRLTYYQRRLSNTELQAVTS